LFSLNANSQATFLPRLQGSKAGLEVNIITSHCPAQKTNIITTIAAAKRKQQAAAILAGL
jgi:hypothetical protein